MHFISEYMVFYFKTMLVLFQITSLEPMVIGLQEALPKSIGLLSFDGGVTGMCFLFKYWEYNPLIWPVVFLEFAVSFASSITNCLIDG